MAEYTRDEALAFIAATRMTLEGKVGFSWLVDKLSGLEDFIAQIADDNELLHAFIDDAGMVEAYETFVAEHVAAEPGASDALAGDADDA